MWVKWTDKHFTCFDGVLQETSAGKLYITSIAKGFEFGLNKEIS
jgi:hypothetical protein